MTRTWSNLLTTCLLLVACSPEVEVFASVDKAVRDAGPSGNGGRDAGANDADAAQSFDAAVPSDARSLSIGLNHTCAIAAGALYCWGQNDHGQLGLGDEVSRGRPTRVGGSADWRDVCGGEEHTCARRDDGTTYCWGKNLHGELGVGDFNQRSLPTRVEAAPYVHIACGGYNSCGILADGNLQCWGDNFEGKLGLNDPYDSPDSPLPVTVTGKLSFREVALGQGNTCGITREGALYCWGRNTDGQGGTTPEMLQLRAPTRVGTSSDYKRVATAMRHTCAVKVDGRLFCWGTDTEGSLGLGVAAETRKNAPLQVGTDADWADVRVQWFHSCGLRTSGAIYCWGRGQEGQLGLGDIEPRNTPARTGSASDWTSVTTGKFHSCGLRTAGAYCWGINDDGVQLGLGDTERRYEPTEVQLF